MRREWRRVGAAVFVLFALACSSTDSEAGDAVTFVIRGPGAGGGPAWIQWGDALGHPGWVRVSRASGEPVYLEPRCDVMDCGGRGGVCGMARPLVVDLAAAGEVEYRWDARMSAFDPASGCESRVAAPDGYYVARFCWSVAVEGTGAGDPVRGVPGVVMAPTCHAVLFRLPEERTVEYRVGEED